MTFDDAQTAYADLRLRRSQPISLLRSDGAVRDCPRRMAIINSFRELETWQIAMDLAVRCYELTRRFPAEERFGLAQQIRRSAASIPANVAEGFNRRSGPAYLNHVCIALGSQAELDTHLELADRTGILPIATRPAVQPLLESVGRLLHGLARSLESSLHSDR